ncbi:MAG: phosphatase PAP2 family protein, partial [Dehalococcoidia bacterium]
MEIRELISFYNVARLRSVSKAARELEVGQSSVTIHVKKLEAEFEITPFDPIKRPIQLTPEGFTFMGLYRFPWQSVGVAGGLMLTIAMFSLAWAFPTFPGDEWCLLKVQSLETVWLDSVARAISSLGGIPISASLIAGLTISLILLKRRADALVVVLSVVPIILGHGLKELVGRSRPEYLLTGPVPQSLSFPSGHTIYAVLFGGILIMLVGDLIQTRLIRLGLQVGLAFLILAEGASRVYLGAHWPSDVVGGYVFGGIALLGLIWLRNQLA